ncbi:MAG: hypothetical protein ACK41C_13985 [Phenylobacterium sp.]|uniref:hypothetical protein n=1 Tax=Phenylobacterium sp. TaxID=1871053 RepID=UPI0039195717
MVTVIVETGKSRVLPALLAGLVPAALDGIVRQVVVVAAEPSPATLEICDDAGADLAESYTQAVEMARSEVLLVLAEDMRLPPDWSERLAAHLSGGGRAGRLKGPRQGWLRRGPDGVLVKRDAAGAGLAQLRRRAGLPRI